MPVNAQKDALRKVYLRKRRSLPPQEKQAMDEAIARRVLQSEAYLAAKTLFCYVSLPHEIDTRAILADAWRRGKRVAVPRCGEKGQMDFFAVSSADDLSAGKYGIQEPNDGCALCVPDPADLCIVPCLAADERGFRLGYGGGYYDRWLSVHPVRTLGLCCGCCMTQTLPTEPFDIPIQILVSDKEV